MDKSKEQQGYEPPVMVAVDHGKGLGHLLNALGQSFRLHNMFSGDAAILGGDKFREVYFRTDSGNIYLLTEHGVLVNKNECQRRGEQVGYEMSEDEMRAMEKVNLTVGEPFRYGDSHTTTRIVEIIPRTNRVYAEDYIKSTTKGRSSTIVEDFEKGMPPSPSRRGRIV